MFDHRKVNDAVAYKKQCEPVTYASAVSLLVPGLGLVTSYKESASMLVFVVREGDCFFE